MHPNYANDLATIVAILVGSGAIGGGSLRAARAWIRKARAAEELRDNTARLLEELVEGHRTHEAHHAFLEANQWHSQLRQPATTSTPIVPSRQADMRARLPSRS